MRIIEDRGAGAETDAFLDSFDELARAIRRARGVGAATGGDGLTQSQYTLVRALAGREGARIGDLAVDAAVTPSTATRILDALERRELVRRVRLDGDRRVVTITLTERGRAALRRHDAWMRDRQRAFVAALPADERTLAPDLLRRLATLIDELSGGPALD